MTEVPQLEIPVARRRIIKRPRLTRLLDETTARVILLVAPAGYGKTTLAREWLATQSKSALWVATSASADVAAFAEGMAQAAGVAAPGAGEAMAKHLRVAEVPSREATGLGDLLAADLKGWTPDTWLAIDDYHLVAESRAAEDFLATLIERSPIRLLVASRVRPRWCTARRLLYGEVFELTRSELAMTQEEATSVISQDSAPIEDLVHAAAGWPAIIGLASAIRARPDVPHALPGALHDYFAEELFRGADANYQERIARLSVIPGPLTLSIAALILNGEAERVIGIADRLGFLSQRSRGVWELHPLLRAFLIDKLREVDEEALRRSSEAVVRQLIVDARWDDAFEAITLASVDHVLPELLDRALSPLLLAGRLETLRLWLDRAQGSVVAPITDIAEAELAARHGELARSEMHAARALRRLPPNDPRRAQVLVLSGRNGILCDRHEESLRLFQAASEVALTEADRRAALWGEFVARRNLEHSEIDTVVKALAATEDETPDGLIRLTNATFQAHCVVRGEVPPLDEMLAARELIDSAQDPHVVTSFLQQLAYAFILSGRYAEALATVDREFEIAAPHQLHFLNASAHTALAYAQLGLGNYAAAGELFDQAEAEACAVRDGHNVLNARVGRARILLAHRRADEAIQVIQTDSLSAPAGMHAEYLGIRAVALACAGRGAEAAAAATEADQMSRLFEARCTAACARAIIALRDSGAEDLAIHHLSTIAAAGYIDGLITAYRAFPALLTIGNECDSLRTALERAVRSGGDVAIAIEAGMPLREPMLAEHALTPREQEVLQLIARGATNREAAIALYISEATVKVHVRHIFEKLGVRTRTEAALRAVVDSSFRGGASRDETP